MAAQLADGTRPGSGRSTGEKGSRRGSRAVGEPEQAERTLRAAHGLAARRDGGMLRGSVLAAARDAHTQRPIVLA